MQDILKWVHAITLIQRLARSPRWINAEYFDDSIDWRLCAIDKIADICGIDAAELRGM